MKEIVLHRLAGLCMILLLCLRLPAQNEAAYIDVRGHVVNQDNEAVMATILVKGTRIGTATNEAGGFVLKQVHRSATLVISGVGIETLELPLNGRNNLGRIAVRGSITRGDEVVVRASTGYQTLRPNEMNGSVVVIDQKQLNLQTGTNILKRLDGAVSGMLFNVGKTNNNPQNNTGISIRGLGTINGPLDPLIVLDGFIYEGNIENINPNDIANITVLRDAAAASVWGARAGNGVIVVTSKRGMLNQKMQVSVSSGILLTERPGLRGVPQVAPADFIDVEQLLFNQGYYNGRISGTPFLALSPAVKIFLSRRRGLISAADSAAQVLALKKNDTRSQYEKLVYQPGFIQQHSIGLRGGSQHNAYTFSAGYDHTAATLREVYQKLNLRLANSFQLHRLAMLNLETFYTNSKAISGQRPWGELRPAESSLLYYNLQNADGTAAGIDLMYNSDFTDTLLGGRLLNHRYYPLEDYRHNRSTSNLQELNAQLGLNLTLTSFLTADIRYQYQLQHTLTEKLADRESYEAREQINALTQVDPATGSLKYIVPPGGIRTLSNARVGSQTVRGQLNFNKSFGVHRLDAIAGTESREQKNTGDTHVAYGYSAEPLITSAIDINSYPNPITGFPTSVNARPLAVQQTYRFTSVYLNASWLWQEKYGISASGRRDGSNIFGANTNDRWEPLWSSGASWRISKENFFKSKTVQDLRLKISYGFSGNVDLSKTAVPIASYIGNDVNTNLPFTRIRQLNNPSLKWEQLRQLNIGTSFSLLDMRISGSLEWYSKQGRDLYGPIDWDYTAFGSNSTITQNVAQTKGRGVDLVLNSQNIRGAFAWQSNLLLSYNKTVTSKYYGTAANAINTLIAGGNKIMPVVGYDVYGIMAYKWGGLDAAGNPQGYLNGVLSTDYRAMSQEQPRTNLQYFGSGTPRYFGALMNSFSFKKFALTVNVTARLGYHFFKPALMYSSLIAGNPGNADYARRWQQPGDELKTVVPAFMYPNDVNRDYFYSTSSVHVLNGSHLRLQYINLSYSPSFGSMPVVKDVQLYANAANLGILWRANGQKIDPDYPRGGAPARVWSFGLRANF